jgi:hypothetical protein
MLFYQIKALNLKFWMVTFWGTLLGHFRICGNVPIVQVSKECSAVQCAVCSLVYMLEGILQFLQLQLCNSLGNFAIAWCILQFFSKICLSFFEKRQNSLGNCTIP